MRPTHLLALLAMILGLAPQSVRADPISHSVQTQHPVPLLLSEAEIVGLQARRADFAGVIGNCAKSIAYQPSPLASLALAPHYDAAGVSNSANKGREFTADSRQAFSLGLCYRLEGDPRYAAAAQRILDAWAQTLKEVSTEQGKSVLNFNIQYMVAAASWVRGANGWNSAPFDRFLVEVVLPHSNSDKVNNHGAWGVYLDASIAAYLGDSDRLAKARERWSWLIAGAVAPDGILTLEVERSGTSNWRGGPDKGIKGIAYTHYFMLPASLAAKIFADHGQDVWMTPSGLLFEKAFHKAAAFTRYPKTFPYYASNDGKLSGVRNAGYFPLLLRYYRNADAEIVVKQGDLNHGGFILLESLFAPPQSGSKPN